MNAKMPVEELEKLRHDIGAVAAHALANADRDIKRLVEEAKALVDTIKILQTTDAVAFLKADVVLAGVFESRGLDGTSLVELRVGNDAYVRLGEITAPPKGRYRALVLLFAEGK